MNKITLYFIEKKSSINKQEDYDISSLKPSKESLLAGNLLRGKNGLKAILRSYAREKTHLKE